MTGSTRRQMIAAGVLVGVVVLALGVGSGLALVVSSTRTSSGNPAATTPASPSPAVAADSPVPISLEEVPIVASRPLAAARLAPAPAGSPATAAVTAGPPAAPAPASAAAAVAPPAVLSADSCSPDAVGTFNKHIQAAHLETSPGQQVTDLLDANKYTLTHTVLAKNMVFGSC